MVSSEELKRKYDMFTECWRLFKKYADVKNDDEYWESVVSESNAIAKQYGNCRFVRDLLLAVISELETKAKEVIRNAEAQ